MITQEQEKHKYLKMSNQGEKTPIDSEEETRARSVELAEKRSALTSIASEETRQARGDDEQRGGFSPDDIALLLSDDEDYNEEATPPTTPLLLTRGAHTTPLPLKPQKTMIDWISFTCEETTEILEQFLKILLPKAIAIPLNHGQSGYKYLKELSINGLIIGRIGYGSSHGRNLFTLTGKGCSLIDFSLFAHWFNLLNEPRISRVDIALDFFHGEVSHDMIMQAYSEEKFKPLKSSINPSINVITSNDSEGNNLGRTINIGNKKSSKFIRCYEKGLERYAKLTKNLQPHERESFFNKIDYLLCSDLIEGGAETKLLDWYRLEVQYGNADRVLTIETITNRDNYFSGAYPFCEEMLKVERAIPVRKPNGLEVDIEQTFSHIRHQYGSFITTMLQMGMTPEEVLAKIVNGKTSQRIIRHGTTEDIKPYDPSMIKGI